MVMENRRGRIVSFTIFCFLFVERLFSSNFHSLSYFLHRGRFNPRPVKCTSHIKENSVYVHVLILWNVQCYNHTPLFLFTLEKRDKEEKHYACSSLSCHLSRRQMWEQNKNRKIPFEWKKKTDIRLETKRKKEKTCYSILEFWFYSVLSPLILSFLCISSLGSVFAVDSVSPASLILHLYWYYWCMLFSLPFPVHPSFLLLCSRRIRKGIRKWTEWKEGGGGGEGNVPLTAGLDEMCVSEWTKKRQTVNEKRRNTSKREKWRRHRLLNTKGGWKGKDRQAAK